MSFLEMHQDLQNDLNGGTLTLNSVDNSAVTSGTTPGSGSLSPTGWPRATLVCRPNSHPFQVN